MPYPPPIRLARPCLMACLMIGLAACAWTPISRNPNRIRSPERLAFEACKKDHQGDENACAQERQALLERQEFEMLDSDR